MATMAMADMLAVMKGKMGGTTITIPADGMRLMVLITRRKEPRGHGGAVPHLQCAVRRLQPQAGAVQC